jgi:hypothetical protein
MKRTIRLSENELIPYLKKRYEIRLHQAWERKKQQQ